MNTEYKFACDEFTEVPEDVDEFIDWLNAQVKKTGVDRELVCIQISAIGEGCGCFSLSYRQ